MTRLCAWCQAAAPSTSPVLDTESTTTHLLCPACSDDLRRHHGTEILARVEEMHHAAVAVDAEIRIRAANQPACDLLQADWVSLLGRRLCDVFGCRQEHDLGTDSTAAPTSQCPVHCLVTRTLQMGTIGTIALPANDSRAPSLAAHLITSLLAGEVVALRIDPLADTA